MTLSAMLAARAARVVRASRGHARHRTAFDGAAWLDLCDGCGRLWRVCAADSRPCVCPVCDRVHPCEC